MIVSKKNVFLYVEIKGMTTQYYSLKNSKKMKNGEARIFKSLYSKTYRVEECISGTLYYTHTDTYQEAIDYCNKSNLKIIDKEELESEKSRIIKELKNLCQGFLITSQYHKDNKELEETQFWKGDSHGRSNAYGIAAEELKKIITKYE